MASSSDLYLLFESAAGYLLARVKEWEHIAQNVPVVREAADDPSRFLSMVETKAFLPFKNAQEAVDNMTAVANGQATKELVSFLEINFPKVGKKKGKDGSVAGVCLLGVSDAGLGKTLAGLGFPAHLNPNVQELLRGCRTHLQRMAKSLKGLPSLSRFQVGLGHSYSRTRIQFDPNRQDKPVVQAICLLDSLDKNINTFAMRVREWYGWHFPELNKIITDNGTYCKVAKVVAVRDNFSAESRPALVEACLGNEDLANEVLNAMRHSMGQDLVETDMVNIQSFADQVLRIVELRTQLAEYLESKLDAVAPNLKALLGEVLAARLISHAGSVVNLAKYPASTIQILGAEKALFRALKTKGNTPKYGLLFRSTFIGRAAQKNKGRISRYLANKCSLAARIDNFMTGRSNVFGEKLKEQVEARLRYLSEGVVPKKNLDVMREAMVGLEEAVKKEEKAAKKKKKKVVSAEADGDEAAASSNELKKGKAKKKKDALQSGGVEANVLLDGLELEKSKKKKKKKSSPPPSEGGEENRAGGAEKEKQRGGGQSTGGQEKTSSKKRSKDGDSASADGPTKKKKKVA